MVTGILLTGFYIFAFFGPVFIPIIMAMSGIVVMSYIIVKKVGGTHRAALLTALFCALVMIVIFVLIAPGLYNWVVQTNQGMEY